MVRCLRPLAMLGLMGVVSWPAIAQNQAPVQQPASNPAPKFGTDEGGDWKAFNALEAQLGDKSKADPQTLITAYQKFFVSHPLHPVIGCIVTDRIGGLYRDGLKQNTQALEVYDWGLKVYATQWPNLILVEGKATTLLGDNQAPQAETLLQTNWPQIMAAAQGQHPYLKIYASRALQQYSEALDKQNKSAEQIALLEKALTTAPALLDDRQQITNTWTHGWMYETLLDKLMAADKADEALQWAKLDFMLCAFDKDALDRVGHRLGQAWGKADDFAAIRLFAQAQEDAAKPNPLTNIKLPALDSATIQAQLLRLQGGKAWQNVTPEAAPDLISLLIVTGAWGKAMLVARQMVLNNPTSPEGAQQVCRVFKAADLNPMRANMFLQYLGGQGANPGGPVANPVKAFMQEHPATAANTPGNVTPAVAPTQPVTPAAQPPAAPPPAAQ